MILARLTCGCPSSTVSASGRKRQFGPVPHSRHLQWPPRRFSRRDRHPPLRSPSARRSPGHHRPRCQGTSPSTPAWSAQGATVPRAPSVATAGRCSRLLTFVQSSSENDIGGPSSARKNSTEFPHENHHPHIFSGHQHSLSNALQRHFRQKELGAYFGCS